MPEDELVRILEDHLRKLEDEERKFRELIDGLDVEAGPDDWKRTENVANRIHNFYMGVEHVFARIAKTFDEEGVPSGARWPQDLLRRMTKGTTNRPAVVDEKLRKNLIPFLNFRHFYRQGYRIDVEWAEMRNVVNQYQSVHDQTMDSLRTFLEFVKQEEE